MFLPLFCYRMSIYVLGKGYSFAGLCLKERREKVDLIALVITFLWYAVR
jgi:hypothetical protein